MKVTILSHTPEPEKLIASAAKLCYSNAVDIETLMINLNDNAVNEFIQKLIGMGHESPLEHVSFTFAVEGLSRAGSHQLVRHRIASYSQRSQRYCAEDDFEYSMPYTIRNNKEAKEIYKNFMEDAKKAYSDLIDAGIKKEDARMVLPNATCTRIIFTMNLRSLYHFFNVRCCNRAQAEIRKMADIMLCLCKEVSPLLFNKAGATCVQKGYCPENDEMSCGAKPNLNYLLHLEDMDTKKFNLLDAH